MIKMKPFLLLTLLHFVVTTQSFQINVATTTKTTTTTIATIQQQTKLYSSSLFVDLTTTTASTTNQNVQEYYGTTLQSSDDLKTNACTTANDMPNYIKNCLGNIHPEVLSKYYGCGLCIPEYDLTNLSVLDLGCGSGRDVYLLSQLVGTDGKVVGIDMTTQQLDVAKQYQDYHTKVFNHKQSNVQFIQGYLEQLDTINELQENTFDVIVSNCVINLCTDKEAVLKSCYKLLKPGGELYFSDVYSNRRIPQQLQQDTVMWGECLSGALYWNDFHNLAKRVGFNDPRLVKDSPILVNSGSVAAAIQQSGNSNIEFYSATYRLQKLDNLELFCEDYGQAVMYKGTINPSSAAVGITTTDNNNNKDIYTSASTWTLDKHHTFESGKIHPVCGNTYNMLFGNTKLQSHFTFIGNFDKHYGIFNGCGTSIPYDRPNTSSTTTTGSSTTTSTSSSSSSSSGGCC